LGCKYGRFPLGHPTIISEGFQDINSGDKPYEGLIKCLILPPQNLLHPVLPLKINGKLIFSLCRVCAETQSKSCNHAVPERSLKGVWISAEVYKAIEKGYRVINTYEVWHYEHFAEYNNENSALPAGLFTTYINEFLKIKQEADGWPVWVQNENDKNKYIQDWLEKEGILLDKEKIVKNPGLRALAKLCLNSFWGKFGQRSNMIQTTYFTDPRKYFALVFDPTVIVHNIQMVDDDMVLVSHTKAEEFIDILPNTNVVLAAYVTAQARLKLYSYIEKLDNRVLYFDTDSLIYLSSKTDVYNVPIGSSLGEMTNELKDFGPNVYISEFVSAGPKNYGYRISNEEVELKTALKIRGFRMTNRAANLLKFEIVKNMVHDFVKNYAVSTLEIPYSQITRDKDRNVLTKPITKKYRVVYDKRVVLSDFTTIPYGYIL